MDRTLPKLDSQGLPVWDPLRNDVADLLIVLIQETRKTNELLEHIREAHYTPTLVLNTMEKDARGREG